jgi:hypothetical protein
MDLQQFLQQLVASDYAHVAATGISIGGIIFTIIQYLDNNFNLPPAVKRWGAIVAAIVLPPLAYYGLTSLTHAALTANGWFLVLCVAASTLAHVTSQVMHKSTEPTLPVNG